MTYLFTSCSQLLTGYNKFLFFLLCCYSPFFILLFLSCLAWCVLFHRLTTSCILPHSSPSHSTNWFIFHPKQLHHPIKHLLYTPPLQKHSTFICSFEGFRPFFLFLKQFKILNFILRHFHFLSINSCIETDTSLGLLQNIRERIHSLSIPLTIGLISPPYEPSRVSFCHSRIRRQTAREA